MFYKTKLKNGITLITVPVKGTQSTTVLALFPVGSRYETKKLSGASHFVEHMMFKGTSKRPTAQDISRVIEAAGADYNAFTYKDYTGYYVKIDTSQQEIAFDLLSDMIFNSVIKEEEAEKEKGAIVEELRMYQDNPTMAIDLLSDRLVFGDNQLGWDIGGSEETVRGMSREELWNYYQTHYSAKNLVLVVAGNIDRTKLKKLVGYFANQKSPRKSTSPQFYKNQFNTFTWPAKRVNLADRVMVEERKVDQAQVILNFPGLKNNHPDRFALSVLLTILGSGMSSRLFVEVREKRGLAYMVRAGATTYRDSGICYVQAGLDPKRLGEALQVIKKELARIGDEPVTSQEFRNAKSHISGKLALSLEDSSSQAEWYAKQFLFSSSIQTPGEVVRKIKKVTIADIQRVAKNLLRWEEARMAFIGPFNKAKVLETIPQ